MDYSKLTLGELLSEENSTIKRNAVSILKEYQTYKCHHENSIERGTAEICSKCGEVQDFQAEN